MKCICSCHVAGMALGIVDFSPCLECKYSHDDER